MIRKGQRIYSMLHHKCPRCHEGDMFPNKPYSKGFSQMQPSCEHCGLHYEREPSFFTGAMYVSYALNVAIFTSVYVALRVLLNPPVDTYIFVSIGASLLLLPVTYRLSRSIYINFFISYKSVAPGNSQ